MERQSFNSQYTEGVQAPYIRRVPRQQFYDEYAKYYTVGNVQDSGVPKSQINSTFKNQYNGHLQRQLWNQVKSKIKRIQLAPATGTLYKTEAGVYKQHNLKKNIYYPPEGEITNNFCKQKTVNLNQKTCQENNWDSYNRSLIREQNFNKVNAMKLGAGRRNCKSYFESSLSPSQAQPIHPEAEKWKTPVLNESTYKPGSKFKYGDGSLKPNTKNLYDKMDSSLPKKFDDDVEMKKYEFDVLPTKLNNLRPASVKANDPQRKTSTAFKMVDEKCNDEVSKYKFIDEFEDIRSDPNSLSTISQVVEKNNDLNGTSSGECSQKPAEKTSEDLDRLERSKCTILSVIYDGIQKCAKSKNELLSAPKSRNLQKLSQPNVVNTSQHRSVCSMLHGNPQIVSTLVKEIRDHHLENICEEVKRLRNLEDLSQKLSFMSTSI